MNKRSKAENIELLKLREESLIAGIKVGMLIGERSLGVDAERGVKILNAARRGQQAVHGTADAKQAEWSEWQASLDEHLADGVDLMVAYRRVARQFGVSERTIRRRTKRPR